MSDPIDYSPLYTPLFGWVKDPAETERVMGTLPVPELRGADDAIRDAGKGKVVLLHEAVNAVRPGGLTLGAQAIGDCVSWAAMHCVLTLKCVQIAVHKAAEKWEADIATEPIYGGSRVEVGGGRLFGDGSLGVWAAKWISERGGILLRKRYGDLDLTSYSGQRAKQMGRSGVPDNLEPTAREHPVKTVSLVRSYEQARDAIAAGYPVNVCSMQGFASKRDEKGFARPQGRWPHAMAFVAADDADARPGLLCLNSWGPSWISGPRRHNQPEGSFWVDAETATRMLDDEDSFAYSAFAGFPAPPAPLDTIDWSRLYTPRR